MELLEKNFTAQMSKTGQKSIFFLTLRPIQLFSLFSFSNPVRWQDDRWDERRGVVIGQI